MARYIDAEILRELIDEGYDLDFSEMPETKRELLHMIDYQETADVRENVHGEWKYVRYYEDGYNFWQCKRCDMIVMLVDTPSEEEFNYCPRCGADMRGEK